MMERSRNYADPAQTTYITAGALRFGIEYRRLQNDQGICIHVFAGPDDRQDEVLRFDCFEREPHYHYAWSKSDRYVPLDTAADGDSLQWTLTRLRTRLPAMLIQANEPALAREFDQRDIDAALPKIAGWAEALQAQARHQG
jgi:hypothetical protein